MPQIPNLAELSKLGHSSSASSASSQGVAAPSTKVFEKWCEVPSRIAPPSNSDTQLPHFERLPSAAIQQATFSRSERMSATVSGTDGATSVAANAEGSGVDVTSATVGGGSQLRSALLSEYPSLLEHRSDRLAPMFMIN